MTNFAQVRSSREAHYHFDYQWEYFPPRWVISGKFLMDNYSAGRTDYYLGRPGDFNNSHTDFGVAGLIRYGRSRLSIGLTPRLGLRTDSNDSEYITRAGAHLIKRRLDTTVQLEPHLIWKVLPQVQIKAYYRLELARSNIDEQTLYNFSNTNHVVGLSFATYWSSY